MKRVILVHGWGGTPSAGWFPWLKKELENKGFEVLAPQLPDTNSPKIRAWVPALSEVVGAPDAETYFVGHSMGCQTIVRFLETLPNELKVGGAIFVAGFFRPLTNISEEEKKIDLEWASTPINFSKVKNHLERSVALFSDNDPWVPVNNEEDFRLNLDSEIIIQNNMSHFNEGAGFKELPIVLDKLIEIST